MSEAGKSFGEAVKGVFTAAHGAGEAIRGNANQTLDSAGEGLKHDTSDPNTAKAHADAHGRSSDYDKAGSHQGVAAKGADEFKAGTHKLGSVFGKNKTTQPVNTNSSF
ncbi:hypothetical protein NDA11_000554 [Ustilago hordei]|uniref:Uncharacterized protein n=1 Tax=Ustilago hordei TaxID=120017 RepID=I2FPD1_USTHO|nr:uncharacterized protein UHO2_06681 [Ustilago hordei]KAJ1038029.1 hypothetical protein NDA10_002671 [Ustilago hordei]KAJ1584272.1 hypothetical protein NDA12_000493 [Ustilago hordei]KAJ1593563.1 hypothetical protein NDA15_006813 [Ustilago hordei]KAJ1595516.1 hypothetical protein NDA11_000554 [Ustilago hordei]KAJ1603637.1 hypothetical protein NDA14_001822 [Ustilago hordei]